MELKPVNNSSKFFPNEVQNKKKTEIETPSSKDKLEISAAARKIQSGEADTKKLEAVKLRIKENFYQSDSVIERVADAILKEIEK